MIDISRSLTISGWMSEGELTYLATLASRIPEGGSICEVGSYKGRSTVAMAANTDATVWCVDTWDQTAGGTGPIDEGGWCFDQWSENTKEFWKVVPINRCSLYAARECERDRRGFDLIFIDADHNVASVKADIAAWRPLLKPGGILCGHDYTSIWPGVIEAVDALVPKFRVVDTIWTTEGCE